MVELPNLLVGHAELAQPLPRVCHKPPLGSDDRCNAASRRQCSGRFQILDLRGKELRAVHDSQVITLRDGHSRVVGKEPLDAAIDIGRDVGQTTLVDRDTTDRLDLGCDGLRANLRGLDVGQPALGRLDRDRQGVEIRSGTCRRHEFHAADGAAPTRGLTNLGVHRAGENGLTAGRTAGRGKRSLPKPADALGEAKHHDEQDSRCKKGGNGNHPAKQPTPAALLRCSHRICRVVGSMHGTALSGHGDHLLHVAVHPGRHDTSRAGAIRA